MKRPYSHKRSVPRGLWLMGLAVFIVLILLVLRLLLPGVFFAVSSPLWEAGNSLDEATGNIFSSFASKESLVEKNKALIAENEVLKNENDVLTARAQDLSKLLGGSSGTTNQILAGVLARPPESPYDTLIVSAGTNQRVQINAAVYSQGGIPIGTIKHETLDTAQVSLYSTPGRSTNAWAGNNRTPLTLLGTGAGSYSASLPKSAPVVVGDSVYLSGPGAIPVGTIAAIDSPASSPSIILHIQPSVNIFSITWVEIASS